MRTIAIPASRQARRKSSSWCAESSLTRDGMKIKPEIPSSAAHGPGGGNRRGAWRGRNGSDRARP